MRRYRVLVLSHPDNVPPDSVEGLTDAELVRVRTDFDVYHTLRHLGHDVRFLGIADDLRPLREAIDDWKPHVCFNLLIEFHGVGVYDAHVVSYLELLKTAYTGCNPRGLLLARDKALSKKILAWHRIRVPAFVVFPKGRRVRRPKKVGFPLIVKSTVEEASWGISQASIVSSDDALAERVDFIHRNVGSDAIAEEYVEGRELTIGVVGNQRLETFPVWEMFFGDLPEGNEPIATARIKWNWAYQKKIGLETGRAKGLGEELEREIARVAKRVYRALDLSGFARMDLRMDRDDKVYVIEANPNPDLSSDEDFARAAQKAGYDFEKLVGKVLGLGLRYRALWQST